MLTFRVGDKILIGGKKIFFKNEKYLVFANFNSFNFFRLRPITYYCIFPLGLQGFSSPFLFVLLQLPTSELEYEGAIKPLEHCKAVQFEPMQLFQISCRQTAKFELSNLSDFEKTSEKIILKKASNLFFIRPFLEMKLQKSKN